MRKLKMNSVDLNRIVKEELKSYLGEISEQEEEAAEEEEATEEDPATDGEDEAREQFWLNPGEGKIKWKHLLAAWKMTTRGIAGGTSSMDYYNKHAGKSGDKLVNARVADLWESMKGGWTGIGTNESQLLGNLANDYDTNVLIQDAYKKYAGKSLIKHIENELTNVAAGSAVPLGAAGAAVGGTVGTVGGGIAGLAGGPLALGTVPLGAAAGGTAGTVGGAAVGATLGALLGKNLQTIALELLAGHKIDEWNPATGELNVEKILGREEEEPEEEEEEEKKDDKGRVGVTMAVLTGGVIVGRASGDKFRAWIHANYPDYARQIDLDPSGPWNNSYIRKAWATYGEEYKASLTGDPATKPTKVAKTPKPAPEPKKQDKVEKDKKEKAPVPTFTGSKAMQEYDRAIAELQAIEKKYRAMAADPERKAIPEMGRNLPPIMKRYISLQTNYLPIEIARIVGKKIEAFERKRAKLTRQETRPSADRRAGRRTDRARKKRFKIAPPAGTPGRGRVPQAYADNKGIREGTKTIKVTKEIIESMIKEETIEAMKSLRKKINLNEEYTVKPGDSVSKIAQRLGITTQDMIMANPELENNPDLISVGQKLVLPVKTHGDIGTIADRPSPKPPAFVAQRTGQGVKLDRDAATPGGYDVAMPSDFLSTNASEPTPPRWKDAIAKANTPAEVRGAADDILSRAGEAYGFGSPRLKVVAKQVKAARAQRLSQLASGAGREKAASRLAKRADRKGGGDTGVA